MCPKQITLTPDKDPIDGRRVARNLRAILDSMPAEVQGQSVSYIDSSELDATLSIGGALAEMIEELDALRAANRRFDAATAIIRSRPDTSSPSGERWDVKSVVWDGEFAEREVARLNDLGNEPDIHYFTLGTRVERRTREQSAHLSATRPRPNGQAIQTAHARLHLSPQSSNSTAETAHYKGRIPTFPDILIDAPTAEDCVEALEAALRRRVNRYLQDEATVPQDLADIRLVPMEVNVQDRTIK